MTTIHDITINQGSDFTLLAQIQHKIPDGCSNNCSIVDLDLTSYGVRAQIRPTFDSCKAYDFDVVITNAATGQFKLFLPATTTETMTATNQVWDCEVYELADVDRVFRPYQGIVTVNREVTRA